MIHHLNASRKPWRGTIAAKDAGEGLRLPGRWQCDLSDNSLRWSPEIFDLFGLPRGAPIDRRETVSMYEEESRELMERLRARAIAELGSFTIEARIRRADGERRWMRLSADVVVRGGRATHLYGSKHDITPELTISRE